MDIPGTPLSEKIGGDDHSRVTARESMFLGVTVLFEGESRPIPARVRNISSGGMMIDTAVARPLGTAVAAELKNIGTVQGQIIWSTEKRVGIAFHTEIDAQQARQRPDPNVTQPTFKRLYHETGRPPLKARQ